MSDEPAAIETQELTKRKGRSNKAAEEAPSERILKLAADVTNPRYKSYYSETPNRNQKSSVAWAWTNALSQPMKEIIDYTIYRDWPVLLDPIDESKEIGKLPGTEPILNDQDLVDRFGAGDFRVYLNVNPKGEARRTLYTAYVICTHDFRAFPPTDRRIDNIANISLDDKRNGAYVAYLKANGKIKDEAKDKKETEEMAAGNVAMAELVKEIAQDRRELTNRLLDKETPVLPTEPPPSAEEKLNESLALLGRIKEFVKEAPSVNPGDIMNSVIQVAQLITKNNDPTPYLKVIDELKERVANEQMSRLNDKIDALTRAQSNPAPSQTTVIPTKSLMEQVKEARGMLAELGVDGVAPAVKAMPMWAEMLIERGLPLAEKMLPVVIARFMAPPQPAPAPVPVPFPGQQQHAAGQHQQPQYPQQQPQQLPAPAQQPQQQTTPQPQAPQPTSTPEQLEVERILNNIAAPVIEYLANDKTDGDDFADYVREEFGAQSQRLIAKFSEDEISAALYMFPLTAPRMTQFSRERVAAFVKAFREYDRDKYDTKIEAREKP